MTDKHTLAPPELAERALVEELATQMALAAGYAPHCWPTWEQEATVIIPTIAKHMATRITALEAWEAELVEAVIDCAASLNAAISLLERGGKSAKKAAPSDKMFDLMVADYEASLDRARATLAKHQEGEGNE